MRIERRPRVLPHIGIEVWAIDKTGGVAAEPDAGFDVAIPEPFIEQSGRVFVLAVGALFVGVGTGLPGALAIGFVAGGPGQRAGAVTLRDDVATAVAEVELRCPIWLPGL